MPAKKAAKSKVKSAVKNQKSKSAKPAVTAKAQKQKPKSIGPYTLAIDIGGSGLKTSVLDARGKMVTDRYRIVTPDDCPPKLMMAKLKELVALLPDDAQYERVSVGFPGVVRSGRILTAHNLGTESWRNFDLARALEKQLGCPVRVINDADMQGLAAVKTFGGKGVEVVITLGTGMGSSIFEDGVLGPHLELAHHPFRKGETYEEQLGNIAFEDVGKRRWNRRVKLAIESLYTLTLFDHLYIGGGNAENINFKLPTNVSIISNKLGMVGGVWLWEKNG